MDQRLLSNNKVRIDFVYLTGIDNGFSSALPFSHHDNVSSPLRSMKFLQNQVVDSVVFVKEFVILAEYMEVDGCSAVVGE